MGLKPTPQILRVLRNLSVMLDFLGFGLCDDVLGNFVEPVVSEGLPG